MVYYFVEEKWILADADMISKTPVIDFNGFFLEFRNKFKHVFSKHSSRVLKMKSHKNGSKTFLPKNKKFGIKEALKDKSSGLRQKLAVRLGFMKGRQTKAEKLLEKRNSYKHERRPSIWGAPSPGSPTKDGTSDFLGNTLPEFGRLACHPIVIPFRTQN